MADSYGTYTDRQILRCLLTKNFAAIGRVFEDSTITALKTGAFYNAQNLDRVTAPNVTEIGAVAFCGSTLTALGLTWDHLTSIGQEAFADMDCSALPETLNLARVTTLHTGAFAQKSASPNTRVKNIILPLWTGDTSGGGTYTSNSSRGPFEYCTALTGFTAPEMTEIPSGCFQRCTSLVDISLPKAASYSPQVFSYCTALKRVSLGGAVRTMTMYPMSGCNNIEALILPGVTTVPSISYSNWSSSKFKTGDAYFYVPSSLVNSFKVASGWSNFADKIRAIEDYPEICVF